MAHSLKILFLLLLFTSWLTLPTRVEHLQIVGSAGLSIGTDKHAINLLTADVKMLQELLESGNCKTVELVKLYLDQIDKNDGYLHAMIHMPPAAQTVKLGMDLDQERAAGRTRGPLHGIPVIIKASISTHPDLGMQSTAGSKAFENCRPRKNARIVDKMLAAGMIILGKTNLSELCNSRGVKIPGGWSALGGQCQLAYVRGGFNLSDGFGGHSNPGGSSSGSAVGVAAGYAPFSVGTETMGSLVEPAGRSALYTIKPTIRSVSQEGLYPVAHSFDSAGPMAKTPYDLATLLDVLIEEDAPGYPDGGFTTALQGSWSDMSVAVVDYNSWNFSEETCKPLGNSTAELNAGYQRAYDTMRSLARKFSENVPLRNDVDNWKIEGQPINVLSLMHLTVQAQDIQRWTAGLDDCPIKSIHDLIKFNNEHADVEMPPGHDNQQVLLDAANLNLTQDEYDQASAKTVEMCSTKGIEYVLDQYEADVIIAPTESKLYEINAGGGFPIVNLPLGYLNFRGRPYGLSAVARRHNEATLIKLQYLWEDTFGPRKPPPMLIGS